MNVYIVELSRQLAALGIEVEIFTRATAGDLPPAVELAPGVLVRHIAAGPYEGLHKEELPAQLCSFAHGMTRLWASHGRGYFDLFHSHYWLSGQVGRLAAGRVGAPLVHSMHTMAKVKNAALASGDTREPTSRIIGETQLALAADRLVANTAEEAADLVRHYDADPGRTAVVHPGVNLEVFHPAGVVGPGTTGRALGGRRLPAGAGPGDAQLAARARLGLPRHALMPLFTGRIQPLKAPEVLLHAVRELFDHDPGLRDRLIVPIIGGPSGSGLARPEGLQKLAARLGIADRVCFQPPVRQHELADWYRAADVLVVPSHSESFGLVAAEAQACGTPVIAAAVGGLPVVVRDGVTGFLIDGHDPADYARALRRFADDPGLGRRLGAAAARHARRFGWAATAGRTLEVYHDAVAERRARASRRPDLGAPAGRPGPR